MSSMAAVIEERALQPAVDQFDGPAASLWIADPIAAHKQWRAGLALADRGYADHTTAMYGSLFGRFCRWMLAEGERLHTIGASELARFLVDVRGRDGGEPTIRTRRMYLAEIDRVMAHLVARGIRTERPTRELIERLRMTEPLPSRNITLADRELVPAMREYLTELGLGEQATPRSLRDATATALLLDVGLTVKELQKLRVEDILPAAPRSPALLQAPGHRLLKPRELELSDWVAPLVQRWIEVRLATDRGARRSPADASRVKLFAHAAKKHALRPNMIHRVVRSLCLRGGGIAAGPQILRNEYVARLVRSSVDAEEVARCAGLHDVHQVYEMRRALGLPTDSCDADRAPARVLRERG